MKGKSRLQRSNEKEVLLRMAQALQREIRTQPKGMTDVGPYAKRYNFFRKMMIDLLGKDSESFLPELSENLTKYGWTGDVHTRMRWYDEIIVAINQLVSFLEVNVKESFRLLTDLEEYLYNNLRKNIRQEPRKEKEIHNVIEIMLNSKGYAFKREKTRIHYSNKDYIPDFTFEDLNAVLEIKLCKTDKKEKDIIDEINADIPAYTTRFGNLTFLVYDLGIVRDTDLFRKDIEMNNPRIKVLIIKH